MPIRDAKSAMIEIGHPSELNLEVVERVAYRREALVILPGLLDDIDKRRAEMLAALSDGRRVYGVNTAMGYLAEADLDAEEQRHHQRNLLLGRAVGSCPYLPVEEARAVMVTRLVNFVSGHAGVSAALCSYITDRLADDFVPAIPRTCIGCAGEIIPLAHAFQTFVGVGWVLDGSGRATEAAAALRTRGAAPYEPQAKEGIALLAGSPGALALGIARRRAAERLAAHLTISAACAIYALRAPLDAYDPIVGSLANDPILSGELQFLNRLLAGASPMGSRPQPPVSFRVVPQTHAHLLRTIGRFEDDLQRSMGSVSDSPAFVDGRFVTTGGFHAIDLAAGMDGLALALVQAAELAAQQVHRLLDRRFSGLSDQLSPGGRGTGLVVVHKRMVGAISELRRLTVPGSLGLADTSMGQEDAMTFAFDVAERLRRVEALVAEVIACELLTARQAWALRGGPPPEGLRGVAEAVSSLVEPVSDDRALGPDIEALVSLVDTGALLQEA